LVNTVIDIIILTMFWKVPQQINGFD